MADVVYTSRARVEKIGGPIRHVHLEGIDQPIRVGVHGAIKEYYGAQTDQDLPFTLDYIVSAVAACLFGTLAAALEVRQIPAGPDKISATVEGDIAVIDKVLRLTGIRMHYTVRIPAGKREAAERAVATHTQKCPAATSVAGCIPIEVKAEIVEEEE